MRDMIKTDQADLNKNKRVAEKGPSPAIQKFIRAQAEKRFQKEDQKNACSNVPFRVEPSERDSGAACGLSLLATLNEAEQAQAITTLPERERETTTAALKAYNRRAHAFRAGLNWPEGQTYATRNSFTVQLAKLHSVLNETELDRVTAAAAAWFSASGAHTHISQKLRNLSKALGELQQQEDKKGFDLETQESAVKAAQEEFADSTKTLAALDPDG